jgi:hypothetical protein
MKNPHLRATVKLSLKASLPDIPAAKFRIFAQYPHQPCQPTS